MRKHIKRFWENNALLLATGWTVTVLFFSLINLRALPSLRISLSDKIMHVIAYGVLMVLWIFAFRNKNRLQVMLLSSIMLIFFGIIIEVLQKQIGTGRHFEWADVSADAVGVITGGILFPVIVKLMQF